MIRQLRLLMRALLVALAVCLVVSTPVRAHAEVLGTSPGTSEIVGGDITRIDIVFAEVVIEATVVVTGPDGVLAGEMVQGEGLVVAFGLDEKLSSEGNYTVVFEFDSLDEDFVELEFTFTYERGAPEPLPVVAGGSAKGSTGLGTIAIGLLAASTLGLAGLLAWRYRQLSNGR
jgi:methionine-rich copper-binding protein CopC